MARAFKCVLAVPRRGQKAVPHTCALTHSPARPASADWSHLTLFPTITAMAFETLRDFVEHLDAHGELVRVKAAVDPVLEVAEVADRVMKSPAPHLSDEKDKSPASKLG